MKKAWIVSIIIVSLHQNPARLTILYASTHERVKETRLES